ncbi:MAG: hypothetical protein JO289_24865, partial [Xanthobacteraceae bacterium]|nr:hypothetical protein [Xanthobacteraceae bacterium]
MLALVLAIVCVGGSLWLGLKDSSSSKSAENLERDFSRERDRGSAAIGGVTAAKDFNNIATPEVLENEQIANSKQNQFKQGLDNKTSSEGRGRELAEAEQLPDARQVEPKQALDESEKTIAPSPELHDDILSANKPSSAEVGTGEAGSPTGSPERPRDDSNPASEITGSMSTLQSSGHLIAGVQASSGATRDDAKAEASGQLMRANRLQPDQPQSPPATPSEEEAKLIARAESLIKQFDFASARLLLAHAYEKGSARAAFMMAETYDWQILRSWQAYGVRGDAQKAQEFYQIAA